MKLGDRMKEYERVPQNKLTKKTPVIIRVDGKAFHTVTKYMEKPFDDRIINSMVYATKMTGCQMQGWKLAYTQSDEATFLISDLDDIETQGWFDYKLSKLISISASLMTHYFNEEFNRVCPDFNGLAIFDSRAFNVPLGEVANCFLWRAQDWKRNSMQMYARANFSHKELHGKNSTDIHNMLHDIGKNWTTDLDDVYKNGSFLLKDSDGGVIQNCTVLPKYKEINELVRDVIGCDKKSVNDSNSIDVFVEKLTDGMEEMPSDFAKTLRDNFTDLL